MKDEFSSPFAGKCPSPSLPSRSTLWANPTIQTPHFHPNFSLSYLGEMSEGQRGSTKTPLPSTTPLRFGYDVPQGGEAKTILKRNVALETQHATRRRKEVNSIPFAKHPCGAPFGEGQADMPISPANQGEVPPSPLCF